ncbi:accessory factor UbiK family protein [Telmatospirillum sp. J64-1]|uniref:accessory factor UbiK family protein n=1 Tax=Telmatospirillum sp. J64-1 TaxID=2502183 RepID=UPI00115C99D5|nr:accessory factor UbiK family protein [Telmatospirillum sp. J64-1]
MQTENRFFDDLSRVAGGALGTLTGLKNEVEALVRQQFERILSEMDVVPREEFDMVRDMAAKAREEQEALTLRLVALEAELMALKGAAKAGESAKPQDGTADGGSAPPVA